MSFVLGILSCLDPTFLQLSVLQPRKLIMITTIILISLFLTIGNCQLAFVWLNNHHFQCAQNTMNYCHALQHQYLCLSSVLWACISDVSVYSRSPIISLNYFCGFIDGRNALQPRMIWNIDLKPNIHIHFNEFFLSNNYWYCDYEYVSVYSNYKRSTFCGSRIPWVYDASDTRVNIILVTPRFGTESYQLQFMYYGAYVPTINQHSIIFTKPSSMINTPYLLTEQKAFESFHIVSTGRLDIVQLTAVNMCREGKVVCHDGPGIKSPVLQFAYNQSVWECLSSTFQMLCEISRADNACANAPHLHYHTMRAADDQVKNLTHVVGSPEEKILSGEHLRIHGSSHKGTNKYIYFHHANFKGILEIFDRNVSFPFMLYEGRSCMYGGIYVVQTLSSMESEIVSLCTAVSDNFFSNNNGNFRILIDDLRNVSVVIIHYSEYSTESIALDARYHYATYKFLYKTDWLLEDHLNMKGETIDISVPTVTNNVAEATMMFLTSYRLNLRKIQYINITLEEKNLIKLLFNVLYRTHRVHKYSGLFLTVLYSTHPSNIKGRQDDMEMIDMYSARTIARHDFIRSIIVNMSTNNHIFDAPVWHLHIAKVERTLRYNMNTTYFTFLPTDFLQQSYRLGFYASIWQGRHTEITVTHLWVMVHMIKPKDVPPYAIWRVWLEVTDMCNTVSQISLEVLSDEYHSSSVYGWNHLNNSDDVYMTADKTVNILHETACLLWHIPRDFFTVWFLRHFIYDDRAAIYAPGQTLQGSFFTFHNQR